MRLQLIVLPDLCTKSQFHRPTLQSPAANYLIIFYTPFRLGYRRNTPDIQEISRTLSANFLTSRAQNTTLRIFAAFGFGTEAYEPFMANCESDPHLTGVLSAKTRLILSVASGNGRNEREREREKDKCFSPPSRPPPHKKQQLSGTPLSKSHV